MSEPTQETQGGGGKAGEAPATPDLAKAAEGLVAKHGDATNALRVLLDENYRYRDTVRDLKAKLPAEGSLVLTGEDAKAYRRYRELGDPKALETTIQERDAFREEADGYRREKLHAEVAAVAGYKPAVLSRLATTDGLELAVVEAKDKAGKPVKVAVVKGDGDKTTPLTEYAEAHWGEFLPALSPAAQPARPAATGTPAVPRFEAPPRPPITPSGGEQQRRRVNVL